MLALSFLVLSAVGLVASAPDATPIDDPASYAVYSAVLPEATQRMRRSMIVIQTETTTAAHCWPSGPPLSGEWRTALEDLQAENTPARTVLAGRSLSVPYVVLAKASISAFWEPRGPDPNVGWNRFYAQYPESGGYLELSAVGFDASRTTAIVYVAHHYGSAGGTYAYHLLEKRTSTWQDVQVPGVNTCQLFS